nr:NADH dehydrogenase subunit 2 [Sinomiopteryx grahami]
MPKNSTKILFLITLISGMLISLCTNSWMGAWMGLEINLLSFLPLLSSNLNTFSTEASLKYFLIQVIASSTLLFMILLKSSTYEMFYFTKNNFWNIMVMMPLLMKIASFPFHWWLPSMIEGLSWFNCFILLCMQKIAPLMMISYILNNNKFIQIIIVMSTIIGAIGGLNQISLRKILSFSSINHIGWMLSTMILGSNLWLLYFTVYTINIGVIINLTSSVNWFNIMQTFNSLNKMKFMKFFLFMSFLSLGGLPPFIGFFPKWITIQLLIENNMISMSTIMILTSLITLYFYIRILYTVMMITNLEMLWSKTFFYNKNIIMLMINSSIIILGMMISTLLILTY